MVFSGCESCVHEVMAVSSVVGVAWSKCGIQ